MKKCSIYISRYFFLILFLGFFGSTNFFDHTHLLDGNIIVHSHPFKPDQNGKPIHRHNDSDYLLIYLFANYIAVTGLALYLASPVLFFREIIKKAINNQTSLVSKSPFFLRGPPLMIFH